MKKKQYLFCLSIILLLSLLGCRGTKTAQIDMEYKTEETVNLQDKKDMVEEDIVQAVDNTEENKK